MSKGEKLSILFDKVDILHDRMKRLFLNQGLNTPDLALLSAVDREEWYRLYEQSSKIGDEICSLILNK